MLRNEDRPATETEARGAKHARARGARATVTIGGGELAPATVERVATTALDADHRLGIGASGEEEQVLLGVEEEPILGLACPLGRRRAGDRVRRGEREREREERRDALPLTASPVVRP